MPRHKQNEIGRLASSGRVMSVAEKEDLLDGLTHGPWRGPEEIIEKLQVDLGLRKPHRMRRFRKVTPGV